MIGFGYDLHRLVAGKMLMLGGVEIPSDFMAVAHSDGDALIHSLVDALLGAAGLGDIGDHYPDTDPDFQNADSSEFLKEVISILSQKNYRLINIDATIILEKPKLSEYKNAIRQKIAKLCNLPPERINIKAKTNEKLGYLGQSQGIASYCIVQIEENNS